MSQINSYTFGKIIIDDKEYTNDVIIYPDRVEDNWWRREGHKVYPEDLEKVVAEKPEVLIIGTGNSGMVEIPHKTKEYLENENIELIALPTGEACEKYNEISKEQRVVAGLHLTC